MADKDTERFYWLKLKDGFFDDPQMKLLEVGDNGKEYALIYLKLMCMATSKEGILRYSEFIPYDASMIGTLVNSNPDIVKGAMQRMQSLGLVEIFDDKTIYLHQVAELLGCETGAAIRKRTYRESLKGDNVPKLSQSCPQEIEKEIEIDTEKEIEVTTTDVVVCRTKDVRRVIEAWNSLGLQQLQKINPTTNRGAMLRARVNEYGVDAVLGAIESIRTSDFLKGQNDKGWQITFEWFVKPNNFIKVLEGNYDNRTVPESTHKSAKAQELDEFYAMAQRWAEDEQE